jgi:hypothetical protein
MWKAGQNNRRKKATRKAQALCPICFNRQGVENMRLNFSEYRKAESGIHIPEFIRVLELLFEPARL